MDQDALVGVEWIPDDVSTVEHLRGLLAQFH
jgi:hypothetical protein